jgi:hypothetical protein
MAAWRASSHAGGSTIASGAWAENSYGSAVFLTTDRLPSQQQRARQAAPLHG